MSSSSLPVPGLPTQSVNVPPLCLTVSERWMGLGWIGHLIHQWQCGCRVSALIVPWCLFSRLCVVCVSNMGSMTEEAAKEERSNRLAFRINELFEEGPPAVDVSQQCGVARSEPYRAYRSHKFPLLPKLFSKKYENPASA